MDRTILTLAVDSSQVGTAAAAFDRMVNAGNAAATSAGRVTAAALAEGRTIGQSLVPALNAGINRTQTLDEAQRALGQDATRQIGQQLNAMRSRAQATGNAIRDAVTNARVASEPALPRTAPTIRPTLTAAPATRLATPANTADLGQLASAASRARTAIDRLTEAANGSRSAFAQLTQVADGVARTYRQRAQTPVTGPQLTPAATTPPLGLVRPSAPAQSSQAGSAASTVIANAPSAAGTNTVAAAAARGTTATNALAAAQGRAAETAQRLAEANARSEAAQARLTTATARATAAQREFDNVTHSSAGNTEAVAAAQTRLQSAQAAVSVATANVARSQRDAATAAERHRAALAATGHQSQLTSFQTQQLHFQLHDFFVQVVSGQSPLTAFIQQGSQLSGTFNGAGGAFRAVMSILTPTRLAFGAGAVAVGVFTEALVHAESAARGLNTVQAQLAGTGRKGLFSDAELRSYLIQLQELPGVTRDTATGIVTELAKVHDIGGGLFKDLARISVDYAKATGKDAPEAARELAKAFADPKRGAEQLDQALGALSSTQLLEIDRLTRLGDTAGAQRVMLQALEGAVKGLADRSMTPLQRSVDQLGNSWERALHALDQSDGLRNINALLGKTVDAVRYLVEHADKLGGLGNIGLSVIPGAQGSALGNVLAAQFESSKGKREGSGKITSASPPAATVAASAAPSPLKKTVADIDADIKRSLEAAKEYQSHEDKIDDLTDSRKRFNAALKESIALYGKNSEQAKTLRGAITGVNEKIAEIRKRGGSEASQVLRAQYDQHIKALKDALDKEKAELTFHNQFLQNQYQAGEVSLKAFYDDRIDSIRKATAQEITELDKERAAAVNLLAKTSDPSEKIQAQTRINEIDSQKDKLQTNAGHEIELANQEKAASFKALADQVTNYRANLLQMQGDEAGAAALRAQTAIANAKILANQSSGLPTGGIQDSEVNALVRYTAVQDQFNEVQRQTSLLTSNSSRAEEAYLLAAEQSGKSLIDTERGLYALRSSELEQLGALAQKAKELADASTDPKIKAFAADLSLEYAKAANAADPALQRLRSLQKDLASSITSNIDNGIANFSQNYLARRQQQAQDVQHGGKAESASVSALKTIGQTIILPIAGQIQASINKVLVTEPLQKYFEAQAKKLTEGDGPLAGFFKDALGIKEDPKQQALLQQTAAINASSSALDALKNAAQGAADALNRPQPGAKTPDGQSTSAGGLEQPGAFQAGADSLQPPPIDSSLDGLQSDAAQSLGAFSKQASSTASDVMKLANAAGAGGDAMVRLPGIVGLFQSAVAAMQTSSGASGSSGGIFGAIAGLFGGGGEAGATDAMIAAGQFHSGGIVGQASVIRQASPGLFAGAPRYHTGGIVGKAADKVGGRLAHNEVPAILKGGPKGTREEVLTANDPRHRDNLGMSIVARIMAESRHEGLRVRGARELGGPVSAGGMYRVNEKGPELLEVAGKQYLMMGSQGGSVEANGSAAGHKSLTINVHTTAQQGVSRATAQQQGAEIARAIRVSQGRNG